MTPKNQALSPSLLNLKSLPKKIPHLDEPPPK
ncbi:MAG: hypothetical protein ACJAVK_002787, partial [Akkermansiaceae bacterium]